MATDVRNVPSDAQMRAEARTQAILKSFKTLRNCRNWALTANERQQIADAIQDGAEATAAVLTGQGDAESTFSLR